MIVKSPSLNHPTAGAATTATHPWSTSLPPLPENNGVDFRLLISQAGLESGFNTKARASQSSVTGLYQFVEKTWLDLVRRHGDKIGLDRFTTGEAFSRPDSVIDPIQRRQILDFQHDPACASALCAEYVKENQVLLRGALGREINDVDLYLAHFLGPAGAIRF